MADGQWEARYLTGDTPWNNDEPSHELQRVLSVHGISASPGDEALDLGCGTGSHSVYLASIGFRTTGIDVAPTALARGRERAERAGVDVTFRQANLLEPIAGLRPAKLVFDRGVYHVLRREGLDAYLRTLAAATAPGSWYVVLAGNADERVPPDAPGPPRVHAHELCAELHPLFDLVELRRFRWSRVQIGDVVTTPLGWSATLVRVDRGA